MADPIDRPPTYDWTGRRIHPVGPPTLAERLAPLEAERDEWRARAHAAEDLIADLGALARGDMAGDERVGPAAAVATWDAVRALVARDRAAADRGRKLNARVKALKSLLSEAREEIERLRPQSAEIVSRPGDR